jgi:CHASE3 domain sensor protein
LYCHPIKTFKELQKEVITEQIVATATTLSKLFYDSGLSIGAYSLTRNRSFIDRYQKLVDQVSPTIETLHALVDKQPVKEISFLEINQIVQEALKQLEQAKTTLNNSTITPLNDDQGQIRTLYKQVKALADQLQGKLDRLSQAEQELSKNSSCTRSLYQFLLALVFCSYVAFSLTVHLKYLQGKETK